MCRLYHFAFFILPPHLFTYPLPVPGDLHAFHPVVVTASGFTLSLSSRHTSSILCRGFARIWCVRYTAKKITTLTIAERCQQERGDSNEAGHVVRGRHDEAMITMMLCLSSLSSMRRCSSYCCWLLRRRCGW